MTDIKKYQITIIHTLISKLKLDKATLVSGASDGRTESVGGLSYPEAVDLIKYLKSQDPEEKAAERMRRKIISIGHELNYCKPGTTKIDMERVDEWCLKYGKFKKKLDHHNYHELVELVTQFKEYRRHYMENF